MELVKITRTLPGGSDLDVFRRVGSSNWVSKCGPRTLVASCSSWPCTETEPLGGLETPALLNKTSSLVSAEVNFSAAGLIVVKLSSKRCRKTISPTSDASFVGKALISAIAAFAFSSERPARYTLPPAW